MDDLNSRWGRDKQVSNNNSGSLEEILEQMSLPEKLAWGTVLGIYSSSVLISIAYLVSSVVTRNLPQAQSWAGIVSGLATVGLVVVTSLYVIYTKRLVSATQISMSNEQEYREEERSRILRSLRRGLVHEIDYLPGDFHKKLSYGWAQNRREVAPNIIYQRNAERIGLLGDEEASAVIEYYHSLSSFEEYVIAYAEREGGGNIKARGKSLVKKAKEAKKEIEAQL